MIKVTDPSLLAELNSAPQISGQRNPERVTDPSLLAELNYDRNVKPKSRDGFGGALVNALLGAGYQAGKMPTGILRAFGYPSVNPLQQEADTNESMAFNVGRVGGGVLSAAPAAMAASLYAPSIPLVGPALSAAMKAKGIIPSAIRGGLGGAAYGGITDYEDRFGGAKEGGMYGTGGGALLRALPSIGAGVAKGSKYLSKEIGNIPKAFNVGKYEKIPERTIENVKETLSQEGMSKMKEPVIKLYDTVFKGFGEREIPFARATKQEFSLHDLVTKPSLAEKDVSFFSLNPKQPGAYNTHTSLAVNRLHEAPTLSNLGNVRRLISDEIVSINKIGARSGDLSTGQVNKLNYLTKARNIIDKDIERFAEIVNPKAAGAFKEANRQWAKDVVPYEKAQNILHSIPDEASPETFAKTFMKRFSSEKARNINQLPEPITKQIKELSKQLEDLAIAKSMRKKLLIGASGALPAGYGLNKIRKTIGGL